MKIYIKLAEQLKLFKNIGKSKITINCIKPTYITKYGNLFYNSGISQIITLSGDSSWDTIKSDIPKQNLK